MQSLARLATVQHAHLDIIAHQTTLTVKFVQMELAVQQVLINALHVKDRLLPHRYTASRLLQESVRVQSHTLCRFVVIASKQ